MIEYDLFLKLHADDDVAIARSSVPSGTLINGTNHRTVTDIPAAHKVALRPIAAGQRIKRYGQIIGEATVAIEAGDHVHTQNLTMSEHCRDYQFSTASDWSPTASDICFQGIRRANGKVATRNYIGVISTVNCSATVAKQVARHFDPVELRRPYPNIDGIVPLTHSFGCCIDHGGEGLMQLRRTLAGYLTHANFAAVVLIGLGCEANQLARLVDGIDQGPALASFVMQEMGGTQKTIEAAVNAVKAMLPAANAIVREPLPASHLSVALQCGGSDGYSGITANPALGVAVDLLVAQGGTAILSETPEIYGAEHLLIRRAISREVANKLVATIGWWEDYAKRERGSIDNNPTPGNKSGGLTTILEKSLGAVAKGGSAPLTGVYRYAEPIARKGLAFMDAPGYDPMGATGQVASGANLIAFTTGRGSCFGAKPVPSIKIATNTHMYDRMREDMDINCGTIMDGAATVQQKGQEIFEAFIRIASGEKTKSEMLGVGDEEFVPWMIGAQM